MFRGVTTDKNPGNGVDEWGYTDDYHFNGYIDIVEIEGKIRYNIYD